MQLWSEEDVCPIKATWDCELRLSRMSIIIFFPTLSGCQVQHSSEVTKDAKIHSSRVHMGLATYKISKLARGCV